MPQDIFDMLEKALRCASNIVFVAFLVATWTPVLLIALCALCAYLVASENRADLVHAVGPSALSINNFRVVDEVTSPFDPLYV